MNRVRNLLVFQLCTFFSFFFNNFSGKKNRVIVFKYKVFLMVLSSIAQQRFHSVINIMLNVSKHHNAK